MLILPWTTSRPCWDSIRRPTGHAGTPSDDQQAMLGLYAVLCYCSTRLSARPTRSVIKKYALAESLQRMYDLTYSRSMSTIHGSDPWIRSMHRFTAPIYGSDPLVRSMALVRSMNRMVSWPVSRSVGRLVGWMVDLVSRSVGLVDCDRRLAAADYT